jgi:Holliday junction DNA helicase RuvA
VIAHVRGVVVERSPAAVVIEVGGVGFSLLVPLSTFERVPDEGREASLLTYLHVREDALTLYGFASREERDLFLALIGATGVGPKLALACLSGARVSDLRQWIRDEQVGPLTRIPGVGRKTAERIVLELRERIGAADGHPGGGGVAPGGPGGEAALALEALGVKDALERVTDVVKGPGGKELPAEEIVRRALARFGR